MSVNMKNNNGGGSDGGKSSDGGDRSRNNLIVNYLPQSLKEHDFCQLFAKIGPLKTCKLMYDRQTGYSFGYGFVDYQNVEDATKAIESLNGYQIEHKRLKVAYARPNCEDTKNTNLYIRNIPTTYDENNLHELFSQYGEVVQVRLLRDQATAFSRRIGFVIMSTKTMAQTAIEHLDNQVPPNGTEPIYVKYADEEGKKKHPPRNNNNNNNHHHSGGGVGMMPGHGGGGGFNNGGVNSAQNIANLQNLGKMKSSRGSSQNRYNPIGASYGNAATNAYPYTNFGGGGNNAATMAAGFDSLMNGAFHTGSHHNGFQTQNQHHSHHNQQHHQSQQQQHHHHQSHHQQQQHHHHHNNNNQHGLSSLVNNNNTSILGGGSTGSGGGLLDSADKGGHIIYVYGIGPHASESDLYALFQNVGPILRVNVIKNQKTGLGKGYGFVVFEHYEEACCAVQHMNGFIYNNRPLQVQLNACQIET